jgi:hypothetical protein
MLLVFVSSNCAQWGVFFNFISNIVCNLNIHKRLVDDGVFMPRCKMKRRILFL